MYLKFLKDPNFFKLLYKIDTDLAAKYRQLPCPYCGKTLHYANYHRKGRYIDEHYSKKFSLCCSSCRRRVSVPSTLFFGPFVYGSLFFIIISYFNNGGGHRYKYLARIFKVSDRTIRRWKLWWKDTFKNSIFWKEKRAMFTEIKDIFPQSILKEFKIFKDVLVFFSHFYGRPIISRKGC